MLIPVLPSTDPTAAGRPGRKATHVPGPEEGNCHKAGLERRCQPRKNKGDPAAGMEAVSRQRTHRESRAGLGGQAAGRGEERGTRAKGNKTGRGASENGVEGCGTGGSDGRRAVGGGTRTATLPLSWHRGRESHLACERHPVTGPRPRPPGAVPRVFLRDADAQTSSRHRPKVSNRPSIRSCIRQRVTGHRHAPCLVRGTGGAALDAKLRYLPAPPPPRGERETSRMISGSDRCATARAVWLTWHDAAFPP